MSTEPVTDPTKKSFWRFRNFVLMLTPVIGSMLLWVGGVIKDTYNEYQSLIQKVNELDSDRSKWASLAELHEKQVQLERDIAVNQADIRWVRWVVQNRAGTDLKNLPSLPDLPRIPDSDPSIRPPVDPTPPAKEPLNPDQYRKMQQQRYPNEQYKK